MLLTVFFSRKSFLCWLFHAASSWCPCGMAILINSQVSSMSSNEQDLPFYPLHSCTQLSLFFYFFCSRSHFLQVQKEAFHFPHLKKKVRKNSLSLLKGNILLLALLYVQHFLAPLILNSVHEWMDNFLPVSFFHASELFTTPATCNCESTYFSLSCSCARSSPSPAVLGGGLSAAGAGKARGAGHPWRGAQVIPKN